MPYTFGVYMKMKYSDKVKRLDVHIIVPNFATVARQPRMGSRVLVYGHTFANWFVQIRTQLAKHGNSSERNQYQNHLIE